ncbi:predicted protein [Culex quinquefasciatus]|uniref:DNA repair protein SWI5 homolog n=1 Tax=Culex quinquefasciatus TaxID=7176 RepID=B0XED6_CULQU|nr:predicted protein [Culex quinquefasciatus]|eukprot:XP_001868008.1 predicted protein [Culex quinquefasciatus]
MDDDRKKTQDYARAEIESGQKRKQNDDDDAERKDKERLMELLHKYNDIKDATQRVLGALAVHEGVTVREMHRRYNLPLDS